MQDEHKNVELVSKEKEKMLEKQKKKKTLKTKVDQEY